MIKPANYEEGYKKIIALGSNDSSDLGESERFYKDIKRLENENFNLKNLEEFANFQFDYFDEFSSKRILDYILDDF